MYSRTHNIQTSQHKHTRADPGDVETSKWKETLRPSVSIRFVILISAILKAYLHSSWPWKLRRAVLN